MSDADLHQGPVPAPAAEERPRPPAKIVAAAFTMPLFFVVAFVLAYVSALHAPVPHDLALTVAGPEQATAQVAAGLDRQAAHGFDVTRTTSDADAVAAVRDRSAVGAVLIGDGARPTVTTVIASAGGQLAAQTLRQAGDRIAQGLGTTATVRDVVPSAASDTTGSGLFYLVIISSIGGYLTITVLYQAMPKARRRTKVLAAVIAAVATPLIAMAAMSFSVGVFGATFGHLVAVLGVDAVYVLTVALIAIVLNELLGQASILGVLVIVLALNFPSTGGSVPESMLPPFWQAVHATWFGSGALETFRSLIYFGGDGFGWPFTRLLLWFAGAALVLVAVFAVKARRAGGRVAEEESELETDAGTAASGAVVATA